MPNDPAMIDPELVERRQRRKRLLQIATGLLVLLLLGYFLGRPARHEIKAWQARRHAEKAFALIDAQKWTDATKEARAAYQLRPTEPAAIRAVARLLSRTGQPEALGFWKALREKKALTRQDLRDQATVALLAGESAVADRSITDLLGKNDGGPGPADWLLAAQLATQRHEPEKAAGYLEKIIAHSATTERQLFQATLLQLAAGTPGDDEVRPAAWTRLTKIARGQNDVALDALTRSHPAGPLFPSRDRFVVRFAPGLGGLADQGIALGRVDAHCRSSASNFCGARLRGWGSRRWMISSFGMIAGSETARKKTPKPRPASLNPSNSCPRSRRSSKS